MAKYRKPNIDRKYRPDPWALPALVGLVGGLFLAFVAGEVILVAEVHPLPWAAGGASIGYLLGLFYMITRHPPREPERWMPAYHRFADPY